MSAEASTGFRGQAARDSTIISAEGCWVPDRLTDILVLNKGMGNLKVVVNDNVVIFLNILIGTGLLKL